MSEVGNFLNEHLLNFDFPAYLQVATNWSHDISNCAQARREPGNKSARTSKC